MTHRNRTVRFVPFAAVALLALSGCANTDTSAEQTPLTPKQLALMEKSLKGRVAGESVSCLPLGARSMTPIRVSDTILLYKDGRTVWRNDLNGTCHGLANDRDIMVTESRGASSSCSGDTIRLVDRYTGMPGGFCSFGKFTPYRKVS